MLSEQQLGCSDLLNLQCRDKKGDDKRYVYVQKWNLSKSPHSSIVSGASHRNTVADKRQPCEFEKGLEGLTQFQNPRTLAAETCTEPHIT